MRAAVPPTANLFVWGYRPELFVYTNLPAATLYLDSQPLTAVPADRHLTQSTPIDWPAAVAARHDLALSQPDLILDGLSLFNPDLSIGRYPELLEWFSHYHEVARTPQTIVYQRNPR